uniref:WRKY transcription factor 4 n=1 Tax=Davidia involucrata TaxID=16924 RepID=A0A5B7C350_DAVIN
MVENEGSSSGASSAPLRPTITLPPRSSLESLFTGGPGASPGPMTLVSSFFSENDPDSECRSFSQLLAGAMASPAAISGHMPSFPAVEDSSSKDKESGDGGSGDFEFRFKQNRPTGLMIAQSPMFTIPPGLSPASLLDSPGFFSPGQVFELW